MQEADTPRGKVVVPLLPKVERQRLHDMVVEHLRTFIVEGVLAPGMKLNERELCERLGISRTPLREALKVLAAEGLVDISPNRGASVSRMSEGEIREMFELMSGLEAFSGELACERITAAELAAIKALHYEMLACREQNDLSGYYARNQAIHDRINEAARNTALRQVYVSMNRRLQALRFRSNFSTAKWDSAIHDHEEMIRALEARDGKRMGAILRAHLLAKRDAVLAQEAGEQKGARALD
ncbi:GntR family transcriptional regulator [Trinickia symbiotica]|uniref:GntR family transcriptional regulator n=1 Tax=Trinickia symbiotica TaxID=863227 RepID=A0A2T3XNL0_9BURK|nr:GntR family transcriptional regulator [Trinickia symbiotica]PTB18088.1 GntR family transcriptional regulator [Trinickia symbiotica]